jgi:hypothetical protein
MVKIYIVFLLFTTTIYADKNIYENNCLSCHKNLSVDLEKIFFRYLLKYSSEASVKSALVDYLKNPNIEVSAMPEEYIKSFGVKANTQLKDRELKEAIDIYWDKYNLFERLR